MMGSAPVLHVEDGLSGRRQSGGPRRRLRALSRRPAACLGAAALAAALLAVTAHSLWRAGQAGPPAPEEPEVKRADIVFVIDATGSMGDEIEDVKASLMGIGNRLAHRKPQPDVRFGAVFYRDQTDREIVHAVPLSRDLAAVRSAIMDVRATGGGDWPEHVGIGLHKALDMDWSHTDSEGSVRLIYLVADAPPQQYDDGYDVPAAVKLARSMGVKIQVIGCSGLLDGKDAMQGIAEQTGGQYSDFERQSGGQGGAGRPLGGRHDAAGARPRSAARPAPPRRGFVPPPPPPPHTGAAVGIDFGGSYSYAAAAPPGGDAAAAELVVGAAGRRAMSSSVAYNGTGFRVAQPHEPDAVFDVKYLLGQRFCKKDCRFKNITERLPFRVAEKEGRPMIPAVDAAGEEVLLHPEAAAAAALAGAKAAASAHLGREATGAVLAVPAWFEDRQRQALKDAGAAAGLNVLRITTEPVAAATAYGLDAKDESFLLVFHCGASSSSVALLSTDYGVVETLFEVSDPRLSGRAFDLRLMEHVLSEYRREHGREAPEDGRFRGRLAAGVEAAKRELSSAAEVVIEVEGPDGSPDVHLTVTRDKFEELAADLFEAASESLERAERLLVEEAELELRQLDAVVLSGGSMHIPRLRSLVARALGREPLEGVEPEEVVAKGASIIAGRLSGESDSGCDLLLLDVTPLTIGVELAGGALQPLVGRNSVIPTSRGLLLTTAAENQTSLRLRVLEGERPLAKDNVLLSELNLAGLAYSAAGEARVQLQLDIDSNGILHILALDLSSGRQVGAAVANDLGRLSEGEIERMLKDAQRLAEQDAAALAALHEEGGGAARCGPPSGGLPALLVTSKDITHIGTAPPSTMPSMAPTVLPFRSLPTGLDSFEARAPEPGSWEVADAAEDDAAAEEEDPKDLGRLSKLLYAKIVDEL